MKASKAILLNDFLSKRMQLSIPIYQRTYSWMERECIQLWNDILRTGRNNSNSGHFIGSVVYIQEKVFQPSQIPVLLVIDGQQRLTTVMLILEALSRRMNSEGPLAGFSADALRQYYLLNPHETGNKVFKLKLTETDEESLFSLIRNVPLPANPSLRIKENFTFFQNRINAMSDPEPLIRGLMKLMIVDIALERDQDNPQLIFESMNSTGRELTPGDLIRNFLLMGLNPQDQERLYKDHWHPMEEAFGQEAYGKLFSEFVRNYLTLRNNGEIPVKKRIYEEFKIYAESTDTETLIADIHKYADYYCAMRLKQEKDRKLGSAFRDLAELKADVAFPLLLKMYHDYREGILEKEDFCKAVRMCESYVFRRAVCRIPTNSLNQTFSSSLRAINKRHYLESLQAYFLNQSSSSYRRFPNDEEFKHYMSNRNLYNFPRRSYWLRCLENHHRTKEFVLPSEYTIEHIMPQNKNLSQEWRDELGPEWQKIQEKYLHTLGNLTLTGYNPEYGDLAFKEKRDMENFGFKKSPLWLNEGLGDTNKWNEDSILKRAERLAERAVNVWARPDLPDDTLKDYKAGSKTSRETLPGDGHSVFVGPALEMFESFRKKVLEIDECVTEKTLEGSIVYTAETDFMEVIPEGNSLVVLLNTRLRELRDPGGPAVITAQEGPLAEPRTKITIEKTEDLPRVVALASQTFERQMEDAENDV